MCVRTFLSCTFVKPAELTIRNADVRMIEVTIDVVIRRQSMLASSHMIGEFAECVEVGRVVKRQAFVECQALAVFYLECDIAEFWVE